MQTVINLNTIETPTTGSLDLPEPSLTPTIYSIGAGLMLALAAFQAQITTIQSYNGALVGMTADVENQSENDADYYINLMAGPETKPIPSGDTMTVWNEIQAANKANPGTYPAQQILNWIVGLSSSDKNQTALMSNESANLNILNTQYNSSTSYYSGIKDTLSSNASNALQAVQISLGGSQQLQSLLQLVAQALA